MIFISNVYYLVLTERLPAVCRIISSDTIGMADPENMGIAFETALISSLIAEICGFLFDSRHIGFLTSGYV